MADEEEFERRVDLIVRDLYPWAKQQILDAETVSAKVKERSWINLRNSYDNFMIALLKHKNGNKSGAFSSLIRSEAQLSNVGYESWLTAVSIKLEELDKVLNSIGIGGNVAEARELASQAKTILSHLCLHC